MRLQGSCLLATPGASCPNSGPQNKALQLTKPAQAMALRS